MNEDLDLTLYEDGAELVSASVHEVMESIARQLVDKGVCHIALTGGTLGGQFAHKLVDSLNSQSADFTGLHIWFSDERFEASDSALRNSKPVHDGLKNLSVTVHEVESTDRGLSVVEAAASYAAELGEIEMDICILGLGADGHVASLFPNRWDPLAKGRAIAITDSPKSPTERVSFSMDYINASSQVWIIATGEVKAIAVTQVLEGDRDIPAGHVGARELTRLIVDTAAFFAE